MNNELVEEARPLVQERYASFLAGLSHVVKRHNPDVEADLRDDWMKLYYFTTLSEFMHHKKNSFRHEIDFKLLSDADKQGAKQLHERLHRVDEIAVQEAMKQGFNKYCKGLDDVQRQALSSDEAMQSTLKECWLSTHYVPTLIAFIDFEKDKFKPHECVDEVSPDDRAKIDELSLKLKAQIRQVWMLWCRKRGWRTLPKWMRWSKNLAT